jgi:beta-lysine 5,6-aminomutase alpha subunit
LGDRALALENARYVMRTARHFGDEIEIKAGGRIERRAQDVLAATLRLLEDVAQRGLMTAIEAGSFADVRRPRTGGRGLEGVFAKHPAYWNPFAEALVGEPVAATR